MTILVSRRGPMHELTRRQREILGFIKTFTQRHSVPPTVREIGGGVPAPPRGAAGPPPARAGGEPLFAEQNLEGTLPVGVEWLAGKGEEVFALKVRGDSMINAHIVEGDLVLVRRQQSAEPGDIVVALLDNEATVKRFTRQGEAAPLLFIDSTEQPVSVKSLRRELLSVEKVVGLVR